MTDVKVWAPKAERVELVINDPAGDGPHEKQFLMEQDREGWWRVAVPGAGPGSDYWFLLDGEGPFPDPCSPWQPRGPHGPSRMVNQRAFAWTDDGFQARPLASAVFYELHIGTFTPEGTFDAAVLKLDHLAALGITHVELMPVNEFNGDYGWGYDGVDLYAPHHAYGGPDGLKRLVDACHRRGLGVVLDVVYNHLGPSGNYLDRFGPYHSGHYQTAWGAGINFDGPGSDNVRRFFLDNARMWLRDYHVDGLRLDAVQAITDLSAVHFLEELDREVRQLEMELGRYLVLIAESDLNDPRLVRSLEVGGYGLNAQWSDDFHHALHVLLTGEQSGYYQDYNGWWDLPKALTQVFVYDGLYSPLRQRRHGRGVDSLPAQRFFGYIQNHDQIGNRALGERIGQLVGPRLAKVAAAIVLTAPCVPMLFMGEEWMASTPFQYFTNHPEPELGRSVSEGRRSEFGGFGWQPEQVPDPQEWDTFERSKLDWSEREQQEHAEMLEWHRALIALRRQQPSLTDGRRDRVEVLLNKEAGWLLIARRPVWVAVNVGEGFLEVPFETGGTEKVLLVSDPEARLSAGGILLPGQSVVVFESNA